MPNTAFRVAGQGYARNGLSVRSHMPNSCRCHLHIFGRERRLWLGARIKRKLTCVKLSAECGDYHARLVPAISGPWLPDGAAGRAT